jgi:hypothetical protein
MAQVAPGLRFLKAKTTITAPAETCYQAWINFPKHPEFTKRVFKLLLNENKDITIITSEEQSEVQTLLSRQDIASAAMRRHWILSGPQGKLYQVEETTILEIPNRFYCSTSTDPNDLSVQSSLLFSPDELNQKTLMEWQVSFWISTEKGTATQFLFDILKTGDAFLDEVLQDFKVFVERG